jgi:hypothetical protein
MRDYHHHCKELAKKFPNDGTQDEAEIKRAMQSSPEYPEMVNARKKLSTLIDDGKVTNDPWEDMKGKIMGAFQFKTTIDADGRKTRDSIDELTHVQNQMETFFDRQNQRLSYKWIAVLVSTIFVVFACYGSIKAFVFFFSSNRPASALEEILIKDDYIPKDANVIDDLVGDTDTLLISWDVNHRTPRLFSKWSYQNLQDAENDHKLTLGEMTVASAATPAYFLPAKYNNNFYISGENVASSPAMFSYLTAVEKNGQEKSNIRVVSVGATNALPDRIEQNVGLLDWATRLMTLNSPVKQHTMDYMTNFLLKKDGHVFHKFQIDITTGQAWDSYFVSGSRKATLAQKSQEMIYTNMWKINRVLSDVVGEKFACDHTA